MSLALLGCLVLFPLVVLGLAWPLAERLALDPAERLCGSVALSLVGVYLLAALAYGLGVSGAAFWAIPALAAVGLIVGRHSLASALQDPEARVLVVGQVLISGWSLGWLSFVVSYSGGGWAGDWFEHWERVRFFSEHWELGTKFLGFYLLPARPPLANLITSAFLEPVGLSFAGYQLVTTLLSCLVFLPAALLARRFYQCLPSSGSPAGSRTAMAVAGVLLMLNPSFVENSTFAWTKLTAAFFILCGLYFFLRANDSAPPRSAGPLCAVSLAAGFLAHYSAGPYVLLLAAAWFGLAQPRWHEPAFWRQTALLALVGSLLLTTWLGWSLATYGAHLTFFSNSSVSVPEAHAGNQFLKIALNLRDTLVPHFLRPLDETLIVQRAQLGYWRDWFFQLYQVNLGLMFGCTAWFVLARELALGAGQAPARRRWFWGAFVSGAVILGVAVHGARDQWGLGHICLQPLIALGLAYLAARWSALHQGWRRVLIIGAAIDFCLGIALQFLAQSLTPDRALLLRHELPASGPYYSQAAVMNLACKLYRGLVFFGEAMNLPSGLVVGLLAAIFVLALRGTRSTAGNR